MAMQKPATRMYALELLSESERVEKELLVLIGRLTAFTEELQGQLQAERAEESGGEHGPGPDGSAVR